MITTSLAGPRHIRWQRLATVLWGLALVWLAYWVARRIGAFDLTQLVQAGESIVRVPDIWATVDHPFHASRGASLLRSIQDGNILRWMGSHQSGYPIEFYPLGVAWMDVVVWAMSFGSIPIMAAHKLVVVGVFLAPALAYWWAARIDRLDPATAFLATAIHVAVPGYWLSGGYEELVSWGMVTNVAGSTCALFAAIGLTVGVAENNRLGLFVAVLTSSLAAFTNPRSLFAVAIVATVVLLRWCLGQRTLRIRGPQLSPLVRLAAVGLLAMSVAAPELIALLQYNDLYFFKHYESYEPLSRYWELTSLAVTRNVALVSIGAAIAFSLPWTRFRGPVTSVLGSSLIAFVLFTLWVAKWGTSVTIVEQLEAPRLMPFQRLVMIWLAAAAVTWVVRRALVWFPDIVRIVAVAVVVIFLARSVIDDQVLNPTPVAPEVAGLHPVPTTGDAEFAEMRPAIERAADVAPEGTSIFVIGNQQLWWHEQLWAPSFSDRRFVYDDWMWYWHTRHPGPYQAQDGYWFPEPAQAMDGQYLDQAGVGAVVVTDMYTPSGVSPRDSARNNPRLEFVETFGYWDVYRVRESGSIVTRGSDVPESIDVGDERIAATFETGSGPVIVRQNWYPRWAATVNGESVPVERTDGGFMSIAVPDGEAKVELRYGVTAMDWTARVLSVGGLAGTVVLAWQPKRLFDRWAGR